MLEKEIEARLVAEVRKRGGLCWKFTSPGRAGVPDRIILYRGRCRFVELKAPGKKPRPLQQAAARQMHKQGFRVDVVDGAESMRAFLLSLDAEVEK